MCSKSKVVFLILVSFFLNAALTAQVRDLAGTNKATALRNWPAPLYWQPSETESGAAELRNPGPEGATPSTPLVFVAMTPCRVVDTRSINGFLSPFGAPSLTSGAARSFPIQSSTACSIPNTAQAYSLNVTLVPPGPLGYLIIWPTGQTQPVVVTIDDLQGQIVNNAAIVPAGTPNGSVSVLVSGLTDLVIDINGYYTPAAGLALSQGTAGAPSLTFSSDTGTGIYSSATGTLNFTTGGVNRLTIRPDGDLDLTGNIRKGGALFLHNLGTGNTALGLGVLDTSTGSFDTGMGQNALLANTTGNFNTATGFGALTANTTGTDNTAMGYESLFSNIGGTDNSAFGFSALFNNTTGSFNTAVGYDALLDTTSGNFNTAVGYDALFANTTGASNTAVGYNAIIANTTGTFNSAVGANALLGNSTGSFNTADGSSALLANTTGGSNTANGSAALSSNTTGSDNAAFGSGALSSNTTGTSNIAIGPNAGNNISTTSNNIFIGHQGMAGDSGAIRIGTPGVNYTSFFVAAARGVTTGQANAVTVMIDSNGQLGTVSSSRRFKEDIQDMNDASSALMRLRPVTYRYQKPYADGSKPIDYGLIAEEVAEVYPDLVATGADGQIETVQYQKLTPMLLNEVQKLQSQVLALQKALETLTRVK